MLKSRLTDRSVPLSTIFSDLETQDARGLIFPADIRIHIVWPTAIKFGMPTNVWCVLGGGDQSRSPSQRAGNYRPRNLWPFRDPMQPDFTWWPN